MREIRLHSISAKFASHAGQSMLEVSVALPFLLLIVIGIIELGIVFANYVALVNATREGAVFASMYPQLTNPAKDGTCTCGTPPPCTCPTIWQEYNKRINDEIVVAVGDPLRAGQLLDQDTLTIERPVVCVGCTICPPSGTNCIVCTSGMEIGCPITITVHYRIHTLTSDMSLPVPRVKSSVPPGATWTEWFFNILGNVDWSTGWRMGLPNYYQLDYSFGMPIR